ncbi:transposase [Flavobacterium sp. 140616W15]|nr:transposase [Flavobacterium sp. 140616W15]
MLPDFLVEHFKVVSSTNTEEILHLHFEENSKPLAEFNGLQLVSKCFQDEITIKDFALRDKLVYLHIKRRPWTNKDTGEIVKRDWNLVTKGSHMPQEFAFFFKEINRYDCY